MSLARIYRCFKHFYLEKIYNEKEELLNFMITPGDIDDRKPLEYKAFIEFIQGKLFGDKGYISKNLFKGVSLTEYSLLPKGKLPYKFPFYFHLIPLFIQMWITNSPNVDNDLSKRG